MDDTGTWKTNEKVFTGVLLGALLSPLVVSLDNMKLFHFILVSDLTLVVASFRTVKSPTSSEDNYDTHTLLLALFPCAEFLVFLVCNDTIRLTRMDTFHVFTTCLIFGWGIISLWIMLLPVVTHCVPQKWSDHEDVICVWRFPFFKSIGISFTGPMIIQVLTLIITTCFRVLYASPKYWVVKNVYNIAFIIKSIEILTVSSFKTGFVAMLMLTTLVSFKESHFMFEYFDHLGSGMFLAFLLRFDVSNGMKTYYFYAVHLGCMYGFTSKILIKELFPDAYPDFLCIAPWTIGFLIAYFIWEGDNQQLLTFDGSIGVVPGREGSEESEVILERQEVNEDQYERVPIATEGKIHEEQEKLAVSGR